MVSINFPISRITATEAVRVISMAPPGIYFEVVFDRIRDHSSQGITNRFSKVLCNREKVEVLLDVFGCVGDTKALKDALNVMIYNANPCCHYCHFFHKTVKGTGISGDKIHRMARYP